MQLFTVFTVAGLLDFIYKQNWEDLPVTIFQLLRSALTSNITNNVQVNAVLVRASVRDTFSSKMYSEISFKGLQVLVVTHM